MGGWLVAFANGDLCHLNLEGNESRHTSKGPAQSAEWLNGRWHVAGWRELLSIRNQSVVKKNHPEIITGFICTSNQNYAVDNRGILIPTIQE